MPKQLPQLGRHSFAQLMQSTEAPDDAPQFESQTYCPERRTEMLETILIIILILFLLGALGTLPTWSHSRSWGYGPSGGMGLVVTIVVILIILRLLRMI
jgi:hypothetical protein